MRRVTLIVVNYNTRDLLSKCLTSIHRYAPEEADIIVVDNASSDDSVDLVRTQFPHVLLIANDENVGFARAVNQGLKRAHGRYVFILNADVELTPGCVETLIAHLESLPDAGVVAPANVLPDGTPMLTIHSDVTLAREILRNLCFLDVWRYKVRGKHIARRITTPLAVDWATGAALMVRREVIDSVGGMDERVFLYGEEYDWQLRIRQAGWNVYFVPQAVVIHHKSASVNQTLNVHRYRMVTRSTYYFYVKHHGWAGLPLLIAAHVAGSLLRMMIAGMACLFERRTMCYQFREHALVVQDAFTLGLYAELWHRVTDARR